MPAGLKLYELPEKQEIRPRIYGLEPAGHEDGWVEFDHIDGAYSYCVAFSGLGERLGVCHLAAWTALEPCGDGYRLADEGD